MTQRNPITVFGIANAVIEDRTTHERYNLRVLGDMEFNISQESVKLYGGQSVYPWGIAKGVAEGSITLTVKQYDVSVMKYFNPFIAGALTENLSGDVAGNVSTPVELIGTTSISATGVASIAVIPSANPKYGNYIVKAVSATEVDIFVDNEVEGIQLIDDYLKVNATPYTITAGGNTDITEIGVRLVGGAGPIAMTIGDMFSFTARPINSYNYAYKLGYTGAQLQDFSLYLTAEKLGGNKYRALYLPKVQASGSPIKFAEKDWSTFDATLDVAYDSEKGFAADWVVINA